MRTLTMNSEEPESITHSSVCPDVPTLTGTVYCASRKLLALTHACGEKAAADVAAAAAQASQMHEAPRINMESPKTGRRSLAPDQKRSWQY